MYMHVYVCIPLTVRHAITQLHTGCLIYRLPTYLLNLPLGINIMTITQASYSSVKPSPAGL